MIKFVTTTLNGHLHKSEPESNLQYSNKVAHATLISTHPLHQSNPDICIPVDQQIESIASETTQGAVCAITLLNVDMLRSSSNRSGL